MWAGLSQEAKHFSNKLCLPLRFNIITQTPFHFMVFTLAVQFLHMLKKTRCCGVHVRQRGYSLGSIAFPTCTNARPLFSTAGSDVSWGGVHFLLLPDGLIELPPAPGPARLVRPGGRASDAGCRQEAEAGRVWQHGGRLHQLQPAGVLCGRHAARLSGRG